jgi:hypothetical protein
MFLIFDPATAMYLVAVGSGMSPVTWGEKGSAMLVAEDVAMAMLATPGNGPWLLEYAGRGRDCGAGRMKGRRRRTPQTPNEKEESRA